MTAYVRLSDKAMNRLVNLAGNLPNENASPNERFLAEILLNVLDALEREYQHEQEMSELE